MALNGTKITLCEKTGGEFDDLYISRDVGSVIVDVTEYGTKEKISKATIFASPAEARLLADILHRYADDCEKEGEG